LTPFVSFYHFQTAPQSQHPSQCHLLYYYSQALSTHHQHLLLQHTPACEYN
jgi:hypothetical protein